MAKYPDPADSTRWPMAALLDWWDAFSADVLPSDYPADFRADWFRQWGVKNG
jgi:hypothetical protein